MTLEQVEGLAAVCHDQFYRSREEGTAGSGFICPSQGWNRLNSRDSLSSNYYDDPYYAAIWMLKREDCLYLAYTTDSGRRPIEGSKILALVSILHLGAVKVFDLETGNAYTVTVS